MFSEDLSEVTALGGTRDQLLELKGRILEEVVAELTDVVAGLCRPPFSLSTGMNPFIGKNLVSRWTSQKDLDSDSEDAAEETATSENRFISNFNEY